MWLKIWEVCASIGFWLVIIGVVVEGVEHFVKFPRKDSLKKRHIEKIGWLILVAGLAMEFFGQHQAKRIADRESARLTKEAAQARKEAEIANRLAGEANERATKFDLARAEVENQLESTRKLVAEANERTAKAELARAELEKQIADTRTIAQGAAKTAAASDLKLQDRRITQHQRTIVLNRLKGIKGDLAKVEFSSGDVEASQ